MFKYILIVIAFMALIGGVASFVHLRRVAAKNHLEMSQFTQNTTYSNQLGKVLIMYYSLSGQTEKIARLIAEFTGGTLYKIEPTEVYSSPSVYVKSKKEIEQKQYPQLSENLPDFTEYDVIFVGGPVWWYTMATPLFSVLSVADFEGKKVVPFSTQGSNYGKFFEDFAALAKNADLQIAENFNNLAPEYDAQVTNKIKVWLNKIGQ